MFERDILASLKQWKNDTHRKPLVLRGARQVGKTTLINEFGKEFDNYLYLNLEKKEEVAPLVCLLGFVFMIYAVLRKPKIKEETKE